MSRGQWKRNDAPREGGRYLWRQIYNARKWGARIMYGAMWDEYDEGTQFMPAITKAAALPQDQSQRYTLIAYDVDGYDVPPDWYMRIAGYGSALVKDELFIEDRFPEKLFNNWETKYETRPSLRSLVAGGSGSASTSAGQGPSRMANARTMLGAGSREQDDAPPPPYSPNPERGGANTVTVPSRGPETPVATRPDLVREESRPPPPIPPRPSSQPPGPPATPPASGIAPAVKLSSRPSVRSPTPPRSPVSHESGPPSTFTTTTHHAGQPRRPSPSPHHHLSATTQPPALAPVQSSYPPYMPSPHSPTSWNQDNGPASNTSAYAPPPSMSNYSSLPEPGAPWYPTPDAQPSWPQQGGWNYPNPMAPAQFPTPSQPMSPYGYPGGYGDPQAFPDSSRPVDYPYSTMPEVPAILEPQQLNPGPPPPPHSREFVAPLIPRSVCDMLNDDLFWTRQPTIGPSNSRSEYAPHPPPHPRPSSARPSSPNTQHSQRPHSPHHGPPPPHPAQPPPPVQARPQKEGLIQRLSSVSAGSSLFLSLRVPPPAPPFFFLALRDLTLCL